MADEWEFIVPEDDGELLAELRRHGVLPGRRLRVSIAAAITADQQPPRRRLGFAGSIHAEPDLFEKINEYLRAFGADPP